MRPKPAQTRPGQHRLWGFLRVAVAKLHASPDRIKSAKTFKGIAGSTGW